ncbi:FimV/HubP family polar landmark protein [Congregibacter variabilis]|uniref:FimV/HubP family polar landmark protein n=1 Tax=Congregibacter variabilis TaxID=3081200 RepID=A0ABZ0I898_9GAMM|nr:FimV/HubP family polar landmark protein [Congregibacter sp. IMCC43200]
MVTRVGVRAAVRAAVIAYGAAASLPTLALGLGEIEMQSFLNEPLRAEVELLDTRALTVDDIRIRLAAGDDFDRLGVERSYFLTSIKFDIEVDQDTGRGVIRLSTDEAVLEPFIDLIIEARWPSGRLLREYTVLVDPPAFRQDVVTVSAVERIEQDTNLEKPALATPPAQQQAVSSASDSVALRESSLPAGQMPKRAFSAETAEIPRSGNRYMVKRDETLWQIASEGKPQGVSVQQAMLEIQRLNPEAFINGNINQIKAGYIIYLPAAGEISSDDLARALDEVREQNQQWRSARGAPGVTAAATLRVSADSSADTQPRSSEAEASVDAPANAGNQAADAGATSSSVMDAAADDIDEAAPAGESSGSSELAAQLDAMATRLDTLEQIVSLKDEQIATLEQALREAREAAAVAAATPAPAPVVTATPAAQTPSPTASVSNAQSGGIPWLPISGGLLAVVAAVVLLLRRRAQNEDSDTGGRNAQAAREDDDVFAGVNLKTESFEDEDSLDLEAESSAAVALESDEEPGAEASDDSDGEAHSRGGSRGYGERKHDDYIDEGAGGDALAEADIYIAYGRYLQAIELLETAISSDPGNGAYRVKLIELYVDMGEEASAAEQLEELRKHGSSDSIARGEALLGTGGATAAAPSFMADTGDEPTATLDLGEELDLEPASLDTDADADGLDALDLSLEDAEVESSVFESAPVADEDMETIEFAHLEIEEDSPLDGSGDELDFDSADEELDLSDALVPGEEATSQSVAPDSDDVETEELLIADDADQMATKLDLARAYLDMGDNDGARGILEEVIEKGTEEQQQESRDLLTRIA